MKLRFVIGEVSVASVGVAVVGSGLMGRKWAEVAARLSGRTSLTGVAGGRRAAGLAADFGCPLYESFEQLIADPRAGVVVVATPPAAHCAQAVAAARAGKHVLVEKPMANTVEECREIIAACADAGVQLALVSPHRFKTGTRVARHLIDGGAIGAVTMVRATGFEVGFWDTSVTMDEWKLDPAQQSAYASWAAHACDLARWFVGADADLAFAMFEQYAATPPPGSSAMASYHFSNQAMAQVWMSYDIPVPGYASPLALLLIGTDGMIDLDCYGQVRVGAVNRLKWGAVDGWHTVFETPPVDPAEPPMYQLAAQFADLLDAIEQSRPPLVGGADGLAVTAMLQAAEISARTRQAVGLPLA